MSGVLLICYILMNKQSTETYFRIALDISRSIYMLKHRASYVNLLFIRHWENSLLSQ